jgi:predicted nucleic acid-binding protein
MKPATKTAPHPNSRLERRIEEHKAEVVRLRAELGDPQAALDAFIRETFDVEALLPDDPASPDARTTWWDDANDGSNVLVERFVAPFVGSLPPSSASVNAQRARRFFGALNANGGVGLATPTVFVELIHAAIKALYKQERRRLGPTAAATYGRPINDWLDLYKADPSFLQTSLPRLQRLRQLLTANGILVLAPEDLGPVGSGREHDDELVRLVARHGLDSGDASILLEAQRAGVTDIVTLDADLRRAQADFTVYTRLCPGWTGGGAVAPPAATRRTRRSGGCARGRKREGIRTPN